jgi:hypothetical protein
VLNQEAFAKYMQEIKARINQLDGEMKKQTEDVLKTVYDNYQRTLLDRIANELALVDEFRIKGNDFEVNRHLQLADIFKSILDNHLLYGPVTQGVKNASTTEPSNDASANA